MKILLILSLIVSSAISLAKDFQRNDLLGFWLSQEGTAVIQVKKEKDKYFGNIVWLKRVHDGEVKVVLDTKNPDKSKRKNNLMGMRLLKNFYFKNGSWKGGTIYDAKSGKKYDANIKLKDSNTLKLRGYVGISLFGRTSTWSRQKSATPDKYSK